MLFLREDQVCCFTFILPLIYIRHDKGVILNRPAYRLDYAVSSEIWPWRGSCKRRWVNDLHNKQLSLSRPLK